MASLWHWQKNSTGMPRLFGLTSVSATDEWRMIALAPQTGILYYLAFVDRGEVRRIISLRRANRREVKHYVQSI
jgi:uncharacterized DUF497 family protein